MGEVVHGPETATARAGDALELARADAPAAGDVRVAQLDGGRAGAAVLVTGRSSGHSCRPSLSITTNATPLSTTIPTPTQKTM